MSDENLKKRALHYHKYPRPGKLTITATKPLGNAQDLSLAYSPGVAEACLEIVDDPQTVRDYTIKGNLVGVITNGTAVLGLGNIGPLASKPVMEGKAVLFKKFADIDVFDIEIDETDPKKLADIIASLEPTFGAINLEDIKAPECFEVETDLRERMNIPVFHDDQHGTAIVAGAAVFNALRLVKKNIEDVKIVTTGGGAAGIACLNLLLTLGAQKKNIYLYDHSGHIHTGHNSASPQKMAFAQDIKIELNDALVGADIFLGLSAPNLLSAEMIKPMARDPIILALANPTPEIMPEVALAARPDAIIATGRSDSANQVNNVLCFPFIFRGALDVGATTINEEMKRACVVAIADLAMVEASEVVANAYRGERLTFGREYVIPKPFDQRLLVEIAPAVAKAAMDSGVATRPIEDFDAYKNQLEQFVYRSQMLMKPVLDKAKTAPKRIVYAEGEDRRVLRTVQTVIDEGIAIPILIGRPDVIANRCEQLGLHIRPHEDFEICNPENDERYVDYWKEFHNIMKRDGITPAEARTIIRTNSTAIAAIMLKRGEVDTMICGSYGEYFWHLKYVLSIIGKRENVKQVSAMSGLVLDSGALFFCDTYVTPDPTIDEIVETTLMAAEELQRFGITPKIALVSHSNFGNAPTKSAVKMRKAVEVLNQIAPELEVDGEMHADAAMDPEIRANLFPDSRLTGRANLLVFPSLDAANSCFNLLKSLGNGLNVGPILLGMKQPVHIVTDTVTSRGLMNLTALSVVDAQIAKS
ncbi:MAG: NADP-dependent malic enzyme [Rhizobiales bacterium]|nr:NADP-dependent malic enzyme [Hyphomicrobiales bacterium]NRB15149.1 NADP-dependent malic enzyme [Hyphomicrobiales bacterium]